MGKMLLHGRKIVGGKVSGEALVSHTPISFWGCVDPFTGILTEAGHELEGQSLTGKILVFPTGKGSTEGSHRILELATRGLGPLGFINIKGEVVTVLGAVLAEIPMVDRLDQDPVAVIKTGDKITLDADNGVVEVD